MFEYLRSNWDSNRLLKRLRRSRGGSQRQSVDRRMPCVEILEGRSLLSTTIAQFPVDTANSAPYAAATGSDGNLWFTENQAGKIGVLNPTTNVVTEFPLPSSASGPTGIVAGPNGNLWFTEFGADKIGEINPTTHAITEFAIPTAAAGPNGITVGADGALWFTEFSASQIGRIDPNTGAIVEFATPTASSEPYGITAGPNGAVWFTEFGASKIGAINVTTHISGEIATPSMSSGPTGITVGANGNIWFTEETASKIGEVNAAGAIGEIATPTANSEPVGITSGPDGNLWFAESGADQIGEVSLASITITETPIPTAGASPVQIAAGPSGSLYFVESVGNQIGEILAPPTITASPASTTIVENQSATFTAASTGLPTATVQWEVSTNGGAAFTPVTNGGDYSGATTNTLTITGALAGMSGYEYEAVYTNSVSSATTSPATLTVTPALSIAPALPQGVVGATYNQTIAVIGSTTGFTLFSISDFSAGTTGLTLGAISTNPVAGTISINGTPTAAGTASFTITVANSAGNTLTQTLNITIQSPLSIATASLPPATAASNYDQTISVVGGAMPYTTFSVTNFSGGSTGIAAGQISASASAGTFIVNGTPTAAGAFSFTVNVTDSAGTILTKTYTIVVNPALIITPSLPQGTSGVAYRQTLTVSGGGVPYPTFTIGGFNSGTTGLALGDIAVNMVAGTITVSGTPTGAGTLSFTVNVVDADGAVLNKSYALIINPPLSVTPSLSAGTVGANYNQTITVVGGTTPYTTFTVTGFSGGTTGLTSGEVSVNPTAGTIVVSGMPTAAGTATFTANVADTAGGTLIRTFTITINPAPTISSLTTTTWTAGVAGFTGTMTISDGTPPHSVFTASGLPMGLTAVVNGNTISFTGTPMMAGTFANGSVTIHDAAGAVVTKTFSITISPALTIGNLTTTQWTAGSPSYSGVMTVGGGTGALNVGSVTGLPTGLTLVLNGNTLSFTGTPMAAATFAGSVTLHDSLGASVTKTFSITINPPLALASPTASQWTAGTAGFTSSLNLSGGTGPFVLAGSSGLPAGVTAVLSGNAIRLTGTPSAPGTYTGSITIDDASGASVTKTFSITINPPLVIVSATVPASTMALSYTDVVQSTGGTGDVTYVLAAGSLPPGMRISSSGVISGVSRGFGSFSFTILATDAVGAASSHKYTMVLSFR
jgi:large repetitive protein